MNYSVCKRPIRRHWKCLQFIAAVMLLSASMAQAKVGDSLAQLCKRFGAYTIVSEGIYEFNIGTSQMIVPCVVNNTSMEELYVFYRPLNSGEPPKEIVRSVLDSTS